MHTLIASAALTHSRIFAGEVAGVLADPGRLNPSVSIAVAMVLAVNMPLAEKSTHGSSQADIVRTSTSTCARARISLDIGQDRILGLAWVIGVLESIVVVSSVGFVASSDVDGLLEELRVTRVDSAAVDHDRRPVMSCHGHDTSGHVLIATGNCNVGVI